MNHYAKTLLALVFVATWSVGCVRNQSASTPEQRRSPAGMTAKGSTSRPAAPKPKVKPTTAKVGKYMRATFAAGCFWCIQPPFDKLKGVISTKVGYTGGVKPNPTYKQVAYGLTKHAEAIEVVYDPKVVSYATLLKVFWTQIDPTVTDRQFVDVGPHYRAAVFYHNEDQRKLAEKTKQLIAQSGCFKSPIVTFIVPARPFYDGEKYHQKFYKKSTYRYKSYRIGSGRDRFIERYWSRCKVLNNWPK